MTKYRIARFDPVRLILVGSIYAASAIVAGKDVEPIPSVQDALHAREVATTDQERLSAFEKAKNLCGKNRQTLLLQAIYYSAQAGDNDERRANMDAYVAWKLGFSKKEMLDFLIPYGDSDNPKVRASVYRYLLGPQLTVEDIQTIIANNKEHPPRNLIESYYNGDDPGLGLRTMVRIYSNETSNAAQVLQFEQRMTKLMRVVEKDGVDPDQKAEAVANLRKLASHSGWWVRLYAAAVMRREKAFRDPEVLKNLIEDENPLVRKFAQPQQPNNERSPP